MSRELFRSNWITVYGNDKNAVEWLVYGSGADWNARDASSTTGESGQHKRWFARREDAETYAKDKVGRARKPSDET